MSDYCPDKWVIVRLTTSIYPPIDKVLGSWYGGYTGSDNWRMSSGIIKVVPQDNHYEVHNHSGSIYMLAKGAEGMSAHTAAVVKNLIKQMEENELGTISVINIQDVTV